MTTSTEMHADLTALAPFPVRVGLPRPEMPLEHVRRILVPLDGSGFAEHALPWALELAHRTDAALDLVLVHLAPAPNLLGELPASELWHENARKVESLYVDDLARRLRDREKLEVDATLLEGRSVSRALIDEIGNRQVDLVVMTTHGRKGMERAWLGSVADGLLRRMRAPVLLVRPEATTREVERRESLFRKVLVAVDGSDIAEQALATALALGSLDGARFEVLRVVTPAPLVFSEYVAPTGELAENVVEMERNAAVRYLQTLNTELGEHGYTVATRVATDPDPARAVLRRAARTGADLVVVGTHGRRGIGRMILGSVADKVIRGATVPVLVVPREEEPVVR